MNYKWKHIYIYYSNKYITLWKDQCLLEYSSSQTEMLLCTQTDLQI